jgi:hypothetical protein
MEKERIIKWFIFTNDGYTNQSISRELPAENTHFDKMCAEGIQRNLWECDGQFITKMLKNKKVQKLVFDIYKQDGKYGTIKKASFFKTKK